MKRIIGKFACTSLGLLYCAQPLAAQPCCEPVMDWYDMCGDFEIGIHALALTPSGCSFDYATQASGVVPQDLTLRTARVGCNLDWGFRLFGRYINSCNLVGLSYQWLEAHSADAVVGLGAFRGIAGVNAAAGQAALRWQYQRLDARVGQYISQACGCNFYLFGNARWADVRLNRAVRAVTAEGVAFNYHDKATLEGGAVGVGGGAELDLWCNFGVFGDLNFIGVIGRRATREVRAPANPQNATILARVPYEKDTCVIPEVDFRLGFNYTWACRCWALVGEIGYQVDHFWNAFSFPSGDVGLGNAAAIENRFRQCENVGFSGLFFGGRFVF